MHTYDRHFIKRMTSALLQSEIIKKKTRELLGGLFSAFEE